MLFQSIFCLFLINFSPLIKNYCNNTVNKIRLNKTNIYIYILIFCKVKIGLLKKKKIVFNIKSLINHCTTSV